MKIYIKIFLITLLCLYGTVSAQITPYTPDGKTGCIDCTEKNSTNTERSCFCFGPFQFGFFEHQLNEFSVNGQKEQWLREQEILLATAMTGINYWAFYQVNNLPRDYNFKEIQINYFKKAETRRLAQQYEDKVAEYFRDGLGYDQQVARQANIESGALQILIEDGTQDNARYGDLKYKGTYFRDIPSGDARRIASNLRGARDTQRDRYKRLHKLLSRLERSIKEEWIADYLASQLRDHYTKGSYEDSIRFMTWYVAGINTPTNYVEIPPIVDEHTAFSLSNYDYTQLIAAVVDLSPEMEGYRPPTFPELSPEDALVQYAVEQMDFDIARLIKDKDLIGATKGYLQNNAYSSAALGRVQNTMQRILDNEPSYSTYQNYVVPNSGTTEVLDLEYGTPFAYRFKINRQGELNGMVGFSDFLWWTFDKFGEDTYEIEGSHLRNMFAANDIDLSAYSNYDLGRWYDFDTVLSYGNTRSDIFIEVGRPYINDNPEFAQAAAIATLEGGTVYYDDEIILDASVNDCMKNIINALREKDTYGSLTPDIGGAHTLTSYILDIFDKNPEYHVIFKIEDLKQDENGNEINGETSNENSRSTYTITIDDDLIKDGTTLSIAKTIIHETMHAFLLYNHYDGQGTEMDRLLNLLYAKYRENPNQDNLYQHEFISQYVEALAHVLAVWDNNRQSIDYYKNLSWGGLETTPTYQAFSQDRKDSIQNIINNERFSKDEATGTKCL